MAGTSTTAAADGRAIREEVRALVGDGRRLIEAEIELARSQAGSAAKRVALGAGLLTVALALAMFGIVYAIGALPAGLGLLDHWWGWLATAGVLFILALGVALAARGIIAGAINEVRGTIESIKGDVEWLRQLAMRETK